MTDRFTVVEHLDRRILSNAVYEEWYFQKLEEARRKKKAQELNDQKKEEHIEKVKNSHSGHMHFKFQLTFANSNIEFCSFLPGKMGHDHFLLHHSIFSIHNYLAITY